jgi:CxxC motif-containing protein
MSDTCSNNATNETHAAADAAATTATQTATQTSVYLCIGCPLGCRLEVEESIAGENAGEIVEVRGFACKRGDDYARQEHRAPQRVVTTTVGITGALWARLPVRSACPVPKDKVTAIARSLAALEVHAPIALGETIVADVLGTGIDIIATRSMARTQERAA